jgi:hypothetical protein
MGHLSLSFGQFMDKQNDTAELYAAPDVLIPAETIAKDRVVLH